ncbi:MAG: lipopolysaccharide biosynthesis protein [Clostridia bacterium]|nr:lipopolysaccharide biosynthesis protein [Clostridia bacterium]
MANTNRTKATIKNTLWSFLQQLIVCILSFASRKVMVWAIGLDGVGLNGLFSNVLTLLALAELGVGSAIIYHLFAPIARDDREEICALMNFYKTAYRYIAGAITVIGLAVIPLLPYIIKGVEFSNSYIIVIYLLFLLQTVSSYFFSYKRSILTAMQKQYLFTVLDIVFKIITVVVGMIVLWLTKSFVAYLVVLIVLGVLNNMAISRRVDKLYPYINEKRKIDNAKKKSIFKNVKDIFVGRISWKITSSTDNILISALVGTIPLGLYTNYTIVINTVTNMIEQFANALSGSLGDLLVREDAQHVEKVFGRLCFLMFFAASFISSCLMCLLNPFVKLWLGEEFLIAAVIVAVCVLNVYLSTMRVPLWRMLNVSGLFQKDKYISITGTVINLIVSFYLGMRVGMVGILIGTSCTIGIQYILKTALFYREFLHMSSYRAYVRFGAYTALAIAETAAAYFLCAMVSIPNEYLAFGAKLLVAAILPLAANIIIFHRNKTFLYYLSLLKKKL